MWATFMGVPSSVDDLEFRNIRSGSLPAGLTFGLWARVVLFL